MFTEQNERRANPGYIEVSIDVSNGGQVVNGGGLEALLIDTFARVINPSYGERVATHESGHFLIAYLVGLLPRTYTLSSLDAYKRWALLHMS